MDVKPQFQIVMGQGILRIEDVVHFPGRGTVVIGIRGDAWNSVRIGDAVELIHPDGHAIKTTIRDFGVGKGVISGPPNPGGVLLADAVASDQLPRGTRMLRFCHENAA
jgi:hypothetical protein